MRERNAQSLNGGVRSAARASTRNAPKRPSASTTSSACRPRASSGRSVSGRAGSVMSGGGGGGPPPPRGGGGGGGGGSCGGGAVAPQRPEGEVLRVEVVLQVEDAREPRPVPERVGPAAVGLLRAEQVLDAALDHGPARPPRGEEREQRPRRLAGRRGADAGERGAVVALARLAPAAVRVLAALQPADRALHVLVAGILADRGQAAQHRPRPVDVVHAPAPVPRPVVPLGVPQELDRALRRLEVLALAEGAEQLEPAARQVLGGRG